MPIQNSSLHSPNRRVFRWLAGLLGLLVIGCCLLSFTLIGQDSTLSPIPTLSPNGPLDIQTYDELETILISEMWNSLSTLVALIESPDFNPDKFLWMADFDSVYRDVVRAYEDLQIVQFPLEREERHTEMVDIMVVCDTSARWFNQAVDSYLQDDNLIAIDEIANGYGFYERCAEVILADF